MIIEISKIELSASDLEVYHFLSNVQSYRQLMPDTLDYFEVINQESFTFTLRGMPRITLQKGLLSPPSNVVFEAARGKIPFSLQAIIGQLTDNSSDAYFRFEGQLNPMMAMMVRSPLTNLLNTFSNNLYTVFQQK